MLTSLSTVLASDAVRAGEPEVLSGDANLGRPVRWVHVSEVADVAGLLKGGELILSTGLAMDGPDDEAVAYLDDLMSAGACGLIVELSERFPDVPPPVLDAARSRGFPVVALHRRVRFVAITEEVHRAIVADQYAHVDFARRVHEVFTSLSLEAAPAQTIVETAAAMCDSSVVLEDLSRHVVAYAARGRPAAGLLTDWQTRSRLARVLESSGVTGPEGWMTTPVGVHGQSWGRLVVPDPASNQERLAMLLERAAQALEIGRMVERDRVGIEYQAQGGLIADLAEQRITDDADAAARAQALGLLKAPAYVPVAAHLGPVGDGDPVAAHRQGRRLVERVADAVRAGRLSALIGALASHQAGLLVAVPSGRSEEQVLDALADALTAQGAKRSDLEPVTLGVGRSAGSVLEAASGLRVARHVAEVASALTGTLPYYRNTDIRLHGLVSLLQDDPRVQEFAESELDRLLVHEAKHQDGLVELLRQYLAVGGNKTELARVSHRSRPALYKKLEQIERILGVPLTDPVSQRSLGVALMVHDHAR